MTKSKRVRVNMSFETIGELEELRLRTTCLGYSSMGAYISDKLKLSEKMFNVKPELLPTDTTEHATDTETD